jgi:dTDP-4-amino-4,6-dideoxygalactose transaminase
MMIPLFKVNMSPRAKDMVGEVLESGYVGQGRKVALFEAQLEDVYERPVLTTNSCTAALDLALYLAGVKAGDLVATTPMTCSASTAVIVNRGAIPLWCDVDPITGLLDPHDVRKRVLQSKKPIKAILSVDWAGRSCDYAALRSIARNFGAPVIQDAAHFGPQPLTQGSGDYFTASFQAIKILTTADGGCIGTPDKATFDRARLLRWYGLDRLHSDADRCKQAITESGWKCHMNDVNAAIGIANLPAALDALSRQRENAEDYHMALMVLPGVILPPPDPDSSWWLYTLLIEERDRFIEFMAKHEIMTSPVHRRTDTHPAYQFPSGELQGVDFFAEREVAIPVHWALTKEEKHRIVTAVVEWSRQ